MPDDSGLDEALCALTALTDAQLAGLDSLVDLSAKEVVAFGERVDAAWAANQRAVADARAAIDAAMRERMEIEAACSKAARARWVAGGSQGVPHLNDEESQRCWDARETWLAAKDLALSVAGRFKLGVTEDQLRVG